MSLYNNVGELVTSVYESDGDILSYGYGVDGEYYGLMEQNVLTLMTFNIQRAGGINAMRDVTDAIFEKHNPQIMGFQEAKCVNGGVNEWFSSNYYYSNSNYSNIVISLFELTDCEILEYESQFSTYEIRTYAKMYANYFGKRICIICTHLEMTTNERDETRYAQIQEIIEELKNEPYFILFGDLNVGRCLDTESKYYINMIKPLLDAGFHCANCSEFGFIPTAWGTTDGKPEDGYMCDNIVTSSNIIIESVVADTTKIEANTGLTIDHIPLVAKVRLQ